MMESSTAVYVAVIVTLSVWIGIFVYLWRIDAQARELQRRLDRQPEHQQRSTPSATLHVQQRASSLDQQAEELIKQG